MTIRKVDRLNAAGEPGFGVYHRRVTRARWTRAVSGSRMSRARVIQRASRYVFVQHLRSRCSGRIDGSRNADDAACECSQGETWWVTITDERPLVKRCPISCRRHMSLQNRRICRWA